LFKQATIAGTDAPLHVNVEVGLGVTTIRVITKSARVSVVTVTDWLVA
jgi:hypothetical protein